jgi:hypothetical protein
MFTFITFEYHLTKTKNKMRNLKTIQTVFLSVLFILSILTLGNIFYLVFTRHYDSENLIAILIFSFPVLMALVLSFTLLIEKK